MKKKLKLRLWVKIVLFYIGIILLTMLISLRMEQLSRLGF